MQTNPLLESDMITCIHNGIVELKSSNSGIFEVNDMSVITQKDLLNAKILGCTNNIAGVHMSCSMVATIPLNAVSSMFEIMDSGAIFQSQVSTILTDKGFPLILQNKSPNNDVFLDDKDNLASELKENQFTESDETNNKNSNTRNNKQEANNKNSKETKNKQILETYFSYGEECKRLQDISKHSSDINLHIKTQGYDDGEVIEMTIKSGDSIFTLHGKVKNNEVIIENVFKI